MGLKLNLDSRFCRTTAPSYLSLAAERESLESRMVKVDPSDILLNFIMAVTSAEVAADADDDARSKVLVESPIMGFVYV